MVSLLDVNVLVALFDPVHICHDAAHSWFGKNRVEGWATCPLTENGVVRILSNPKYPGRGTVLDDAIRRLASFRGDAEHSFWPDDISLCEPSLVRTEHVGGYRQVTDVYLLALAVRNEGRLVTFDRGISPICVHGATDDHLVQLDLRDS